MIPFQAEVGWALDGREFVAWRGEIISWCLQTTTNRRLALIMGRFTAGDAAKFIQTSRCTPELVSVQAPG